MKKIIFIFLILFSANLYSQEVQIKGEKWVCKATDFVSIQAEVGKEVKRDQSDPGKSHVHVFEGLGGEIATLRWLEDKAGAAPDYFIRMGLKETDWIYVQGSGAHVIIWKFFKENKKASKVMHMESAKVATSTMMMYDCK